ncbi:hypothetical protein [Paraburkholderia sediminicola]|uniref:hypothetical protein n=1 Tax=Paraburkholderia sediminicola TaxID=458836 RepID=UPI0038B918A0
MSDGISKLSQLPATSITGSLVKIAQQKPSAFSGNDNWFRKFENTTSAPPGHTWTQVQLPGYFNVDDMKKSFKDNGWVALNIKIGTTTTVIKRVEKSDKSEDTGDDFELDIATSDKEFKALDDFNTLPPVQQKLFSQTISAWACQKGLRPLATVSSDELQKRQDLFEEQMAKLTADRARLFSSLSGHTLIDGRYWQLDEMLKQLNTHIKEVQDELKTRGEVTVEALKKHPTESENTSSNSSSSSESSSSSSSTSSVADASKSAKVENSADGDLSKPKEQVQKLPSASDEFTLDQQGESPIHPPNTIDNPARNDGDEGNIQTATSPTAAASPAKRPPSDWKPESDKAHFRSGFDALLTEARTNTQSAKET